MPISPEKAQVPDPAILKELHTVAMPFGKYKGRILADIPVYYLEWLANKGFPKGRLGMQLATLHVIKSNGLDFSRESVVGSQ